MKTFFGYLFLITTLLCGNVVYAQAVTYELKDAIGTPLGETTLTYTQTGYMGRVDAEQFGIEISSDTITITIKGVDFTFPLTAGGYFHKNKDVCNENASKKGKATSELCYRGMTGVWHRYRQRIYTDKEKKLHSNAEIILDDNSQIVSMLLTGMRGRMIQMVRKESAV